jgi:hypothetical protein
VIARAIAIYSLLSICALRAARPETALQPPVTLDVPALRLDPTLSARAQPPRPFRLAQAQAQPVEPMHAVTNAPVATAEPLPLTQKWWFWAAAGLLLVTTTVLLVVATRDPEAPRTRLGNMEAFR